MRGFGNILTTIILTTVVALMLVVPTAFAGQGHMTILAVQEVNGTDIGSVADLVLETRPGSGRVFLQTYPLSKLDTQVSTRFAKEIACDYFDLECESIDFIYTIRSASSVVGGPSAGAAIAALTALVVMDETWDEDIAITATINSGGILGSVGGVKAKIDGAEAAGISKVIISQGNAKILDNGNRSDAVEYGSSQDVEVIIAQDIGELVAALTGKKTTMQNQSPQVPDQYTAIMSSLASQLCERSLSLKKQVHEVPSEIQNKTHRASEEIGLQNYYAAASYCFAANVALREQLFGEQLTTLEQVIMKKVELQQNLARVYEILRNNPPKDIASLQTNLIVKERLDTAEAIFARLDKGESTTQEYAKLLAFAEERIYSAYTWTEFFEMEGHPYQITEEKLALSASEKIQEAEERFQYLNYLLIPHTDHIYSSIEDAKQALLTGQYEFSLIKASLAKAEANALLSLLGVEQIEDILQAKETSTRNVIAKTIAKGNFPIMGYSYYDYALALEKDDPFSSLLYLEYALELSNLGMYFRESHAEEDVKIAPMWATHTGVFVTGLLIGMLVMVLIQQKKEDKEEEEK